MRKTHISLAGVMLLVPAAVGAQAVAGSATPSGAPSVTGTADGDAADIVVTAQRRSERLQDVPMAITAIGGAALERSPVVNLVNVQTSVPNLNISPRQGSGVVAIRGIGYGVVTAGAEGSVALHVDGVYQSRPFEALGALFDLDRIEVARGPQGTLYGRNATGGAINIITRKPTDTVEGHADISYGNYNALSLEAAVGGPLAGDKLLFRVAAKLDNRDGFGKNLVTGKDVDDLSSRAIRGMIEARPADGVDLLLEGSYYKRNDSGNATFNVGCLATCSPRAGQSLGFPIPADPRRNVNNDTQNINRQQVSAVSLTTKIQLPFADLTSITGYSKGSFLYLFDFDGTALPGSFITREENYHKVSQELQLSHSSSVLSWVAGFYYFNERNYARANGSFPTYLAPLGFGRLFQGGTQDTNAYAGFGEITYHVTPKLNLTIGGRYSAEDKKITGEYTFTNGPANLTARQAAPTAAIPCVNCLNLPDTVSFHAFMPKFGVQYRFDSRVQVYAAVQKGFKSGGFAIGAVTPSFKPETIWSYEAGLKASWFDRAVTTNIAVYHYDYDNLQLGVVGTVGSVIRNAAKSKVDGIEFEYGLRLSSHFRLDGFATYNRARLISFVSANPGLPSQSTDQSGNLLPNAPKFSGKIGAEYSTDLGGGALALRGDVFASSRVYFTEFNNLTNSQSPYALANLSLRYDAHGGWYLGGFVNNVANRTIGAGGTVSSPAVGAVVVQTFLPPRTYGIIAGVKF